MPTLEVYKGKNSVGSFFLTESIITIGRAGDNDIVLPDSQLRVSRCHAVLLNPLVLIQKTFIKIFIKRILSLYKG